LKVFDRFAGYGFVHHRALNAPHDLDQALGLIAKYPERTHVLEGDLCWDFAGSSGQFYFRHPRWVVDTLALSAIEKGLRQGKLVGLADLLKIKSSPAFLVIELKVGRGNANLALHRLVAFLEEHFEGRYWIDGFSLSMLQYIKKFSPTTAVTLHTEFVSGGRVLIGAPEWPPVRLRKLSDLPEIDGISIRKRGSDGFMAKACADVHAAGKVLTLSRLHSLRDFECSKRWGARAGYIHGDFKQYLALDDRLQQVHQDNRPQL
jgi:hypothetical protein